MTKEEAKAYALKIAKESGVTDEVANHISAAFDNDRFYQGFVPRPEVDRSLASERSKAEDAIKRNQYLEGEWLPQAKAAHEKNLKGIALLEKYQNTFGTLDENANADDIRRASKQTGLTEEKVIELLESRLNSSLSSRDHATLELMDIREEHMDRFKKRLDVKQFEKIVADARKSGSNDSLKSIYKDWVQPDIDAMTPHRFSDEELKAREERIRKEAVQDFASRNKIPVDAKPREPHLIFDRLDRSKNGDKSNDKTNGQSAREDFLAVLNDPDPDTVRSRYPVQ